MADSQPTYVVCDGGLVLDNTKFNLFDKPGVAVKLRNYEVNIGGGYRRINGYTKLGTTSATRPTGAADPILGVHPYALGVVVCAGTNIYYTEDGITYIQVNRNTSESGLTQAALSGASLLSRPSQDKATFVLVKGEVDHVTNPYGTLYIATGADPIVHFHINGTGVSRTFTYVELATPVAGSVISDFDGHLCVVDTINAPNTVYYSAFNDYDLFTGPSSGSVTISEHIVGIKGFRKELYIFSNTMIHKLVNINDPTNVATEQVTTNLGCVSGGSIQEIGGDLIFLAPDGFRTIAGTSRIDDIELSSVSKRIQPLVSRILQNINNYTISSTVLREKSQYRFFYINDTGVGHGLTMTLKSDANGMLSYQWTELYNYPVQSIGTDYSHSGIEITYHGGNNGYVYRHDYGESFDGSNITSSYKSPDMHLGDLGARKTLHYINTSIIQEGDIVFNLIPRFDFGSSSVQQPPTILVDISGLASYLGTGVFGTATFGSAETPLTRVPLQGSCHSVSFEFQSSGTDPSYTIQGFQIEEFPSGRK